LNEIINTTQQNSNIIWRIIITKLGDMHFDEKRDWDVVISQRVLQGTPSNPSIHRILGVTLMGIQFIRNFQLVLCSPQAYQQESAGLPTPTAATSGINFAFYPSNIYLPNVSNTSVIPLDVSCLGCTSKNNGEIWPSVLTLSYLSYFEPKADERILVKKNHIPKELVKECTVELNALSFLNISASTSTRTSVLPFHCAIAKRLASIITLASGDTGAS